MPSPHSVRHNDCFTRGMKSLTELFIDLTHQTSALVHSEIKLAKAEISSKVDSAQKAILWFIIGGIFAFSGFILVLASAALGLQRALPTWPAWLCALVIGAPITLLGVIGMINGRKLGRPEKLIPEQSIENLAIITELQPQKNEELPLKRDAIGA